MSSSTLLAILLCIVFFGLGAAIGYLLAWTLGRRHSEQLSLKMASMEAERKADQDKLQWGAQAEQRMREAFESLAGRTLQVSTEGFLKQAHEQTSSLLAQVKGDWSANKAELAGLVSPLRDNLSLLDTHVRALEQKREGAYQGLLEQVGQLVQDNRALQTTTVTLAQALKSSGVRGRWGEMQLRRLVEMADMIRHVDFEEQAAGETGRPDMIVHLSSGGQLPVDAKVPLTAYLEAMESTDDDTRRAKLGEHAKAVRARVRELGQRKYSDQFSKAPDFVVMFVPVEGCLCAAFDDQPDLLDYAMQQRVLIATPVTLLALLKAIVYGWQQYQMTENARHIATLGQELYKRLEAFLSHLTDMGRSLNKTVTEYNKAVGSLETRLLPTARRLQDAGIAGADQVLPDTVEAHAVAPTSVDSGS